MPKFTILGIKKAPATFEVTGVCNGLKFSGLVWYNDVDKNLLGKCKQ